MCGQIQEKLKIPGESLVKQETDPWVHEDTKTAIPQPEVFKPETQTLTAETIIGERETFTIPGVRKGDMDELLKPKMEHPVLRIKIPPPEQEHLVEFIIKPEGKEKVNHPEHYREGGMEVIDVINAFKHVRNSFALGNAVKYILRAGKKDESTYVEDLEKAVWYLQSEINYKKDETKGQGHRLCESDGEKG